jgi:hypothetical protein
MLLKAPEHVPHEVLRGKLTVQNQTIRNALRLTSVYKDLYMTGREGETLAIGLSVESPTIALGAGY